jgi:hypothetical protein
MQRLTCLLCPALLCLVTANARAAAFTNGSFEMPGGLPPSSGILLSPGDTTLVGWSVGGSGGPVTYSNDYYYGARFDAVHGTYQVAFSGGDDAPGTFLSQSFDTVVGQQYGVRFFVGRLGHDFQMVSLTASALSASDDILASLQVFPPDELPDFYGYGPLQSFSFTATTATTTLRFTDTSLDTNGVDVLLDKVAVVAVPEPSTLILTAAALGACIARRRNRAHY